MIWAAAVLASQRQPALVPEALSKAKPDKGPPLSLDQINKVYDNGHPSNKLSAGPESAGLVVHMYDLTERAGTGQMYQPGDAQFQEFWATSVVNRNLPGMYEPPTGGGPCNGVGILINPVAAKFYVDRMGYKAVDHFHMKDNAIAKRLIKPVFRYEKRIA